MAPNLPNYGSTFTDEETGPLNHDLPRERRWSAGSLTDMLENAHLLHHDGGDNCSVRSVGGNASIPSEIANLSKNLIGCGVLSLSNGIALYADNPRAVFSATLWIVLLGAIFGYFCILIAKVCRMTASATYRECWEDSVGSRGALAVSLVNAIKPGLANLAYCAILSQTFQSLLETAGWNVSRVGSLLLITVLFLLPLCLLKNLNVLAPFSALGITGIVLTAGVMMVRYLDGSYQPGGQYYSDIPKEMQPEFGDRNNSWSLQAAPLLCMVYEGT